MVVFVVAGVYENEVNDSVVVAAAFAATIVTVIAIVVFVDADIAVVNVEVAVVCN